MVAAEKKQLSAQPAKDNILAGLHVEILEDLLISIQNHKRGCIDLVEIKRFSMREEALEAAINKLREDWCFDDFIKDDIRKESEQKKD